MPDDPDYPDPTAEDLENPTFNRIWDAIKHWDISRYNDGLYSGPTGNDVMHIMNKIHEPPVLKES